MWYLYQHLIKLLATDPGPGCSDAEADNPINIIIYHWDLLRGAHLIIITVTQINDLRARLIPTAANQLGALTRIDQWGALKYQGYRAGKYKQLKLLFSCEFFCTAPCYIVSITTWFVGEFFGDFLPVTRPIIRLRNNYLIHSTRSLLF